MATAPLIMEGLEVIGVGGMLTGRGPAGFLKPKPPALPKQPPVPNQQAILAQQKLMASKAAAARFGRASTILTNNANTGDKLGP